MFTQKPDEPTEWAGLPSEPYGRDDATDLLDAPAADPLGLGIGPLTNSVSIAAIPAEPATAPETREV